MNIRKLLSVFYLLTHYVNLLCVNKLFDQILEFFGLARSYTGTGQRSSGSAPNTNYGEGSNEYS